MSTRSIFSRTAAALLLCAAAAAQAGTLYPSDDAFVDDERPDRRFGNWQVLKVGPAPGLDATAYVRFDLDALPPDLNGTEVEFAALRVFVGSVRRAGELSVHSVLQSWDEATVDGFSAPRIGLVQASAYVTPSLRKSYVTLDITNLVRAWLAGFPNNGIAIASEDAEFEFDSKENRRTGHTAEIKVVLAGRQGATGPRGPRGNQGPAGRLEAVTTYRPLNVGARSIRRSARLCGVSQRALSGGFSLLGHDTENLELSRFANRARIASSGPTEGERGWVLIVSNESNRDAAGTFHLTCAPR